MVAHDAPVPAHEIIVVETLEDRKECVDVVRHLLVASLPSIVLIGYQRIKVFIDEQGFPLETEIDEFVGRSDVKRHAN